VQTLLGHASLKTTMVYMHAQTCWPHTKVRKILPHLLVRQTDEKADDTLGVTGSEPPRPSDVTLTAPGICGSHAHHPPPCHFLRMPARGRRHKGCSRSATPGSVAVAKSPPEG
jgi:hypothetical protein